MRDLRYFGEKADYRHRRLLRARPERPCCRASNQRYELAPSHRCPRRLGQDIIKINFSTPVIAPLLGGRADRQSRGWVISVDLTFAANVRSFSDRYRIAALRQASLRAKLASDSLHSMTLSARTRNDSGIMRPSGLAVLRLITSSNLVGCSTGMSASLVPRKSLTSC